MAAFFAPVFAIHASWFLLSLATPAWAQTVNSTVIVGTGPVGVAINEVTNKIYVANLSGRSVTVIDGATNATNTVNLGQSQPTGVAVNSVTNRIYVANLVTNTVAVIDGANNASTTVNVGGDPRLPGINPVTNKIYIPNSDTNNVTVIDGASNSTLAVKAGGSPIALAINQITNKIYVANRSSNTVTVIDGASNTATTVNVGVFPFAIAVNPATNKIYVANLNSKSVTVIDGATRSTATVSVGDGPIALAVNQSTNKIYVANSNTNNVSVIDGNSSTVTATVNAGAQPQRVAVNQTTNKVYVTNGSSNNVTVIDGDTNATATVNVGTNPVDLALNSTTNRVYVGNSSMGAGTTVTVIDGARISTNTALATSRNPSFFGQSVTFSTDVNPSGAGGSVTLRDGNTSLATLPLAPGTTTLTTSALSVGSHSIDATYNGDVNFAGSASPVLVQIVNPAPTVTLLTQTSGNNPSSFGQSLVFNAEVLPSSATGSVQFADGANLLGAPLPLNGGLAMLTISSLPAGIHTITAGYSGNTTLASSKSSPQTQLVLASGNPVDTVTSMNITPMQIFFHGNAAISVQASPLSGAVAPTGNVILLDGSTRIELVLSLDASGTAIYNGGLTIGDHSFRAVYIGDPNFNGSTSALHVVNASPKPNPH